MLACIDKDMPNDLRIAFLCTPFSPEPMTPMQYDRCNVDINWNEALAGKRIYYGDKIRAFIVTAVSGPFSLYKRMFINRAAISDRDGFIRFAFSGKLKRMPERKKIPWMRDHGLIKSRLVDDIKCGEFDYLYVGEGRAMQ